MTATILSLVLGSQGLAENAWPQWRGPSRDGNSQETGLLKQWPEQGPPIAWRVDTVGTGYSSMAVKGGHVVKAMSELLGNFRTVELLTLDG
jgi:hypothetical protein